MTYNCVTERVEVQNLRPEYDRGLFGGTNLTNVTPSYEEWPDQIAPGRLIPKDHVIETNLDLLRGRTASHRKGEDMVWDFGGVRAIIDEEGAEIFVTDNLSVMDAERRWRIVEAQLEDLERLGFLLRRPR